MISFMFLSILLLIIVLWLITPALLGKRKIREDDTDTQNTLIAKDRLAEIENRLEQGEISQQEFDEIQSEIEKSLLQDIRDGEVKVSISPKIERNAFVLITAIPLMALALYWLWGSPDSMNLSAQTEQVSKSNPHQGTNAASDQNSDPKQHAGSVEEMAVMLEQKLAKDPKNANGWYTLGRTYMSLKKYDKAIVALKRLQQLVGDDVTVLITLADAMTMARAGNMQGEPFELIKKALQMKPDDPTALWLAGLGYEESGDTKTAIKLWKQLLPLITNDAQSTHQVQSLLANAEAKLGLPPSVMSSKPVASVATEQNESNANSGATASITVKVDLSDEIKKKASPDDFVLVYAKATQGPRMPLAIVRKQIKDLPMTVVLDDSMAMQPTMKLSNFPEVNIVARVSKLGQAMPQSGDLQGQVGPVAVKNAKSVSVLINSVLP